MNNIWSFLKKHITLISEASFLGIVYIVGQLPLRDFDLWFHIKSGELFVAQKGLQFTEVFSYAAAGREWIPYEWLFQITVYFLSKIGFWIIPPFIGIFTVLTCFCLLRILDYIFRLPLFPRLLLTFAFFISIYEFNTARPHVLAYSFVTLSLFLIYARIVKDKKWIYFSLPITLIWANFHSTVFLVWGLQLTFACITLFQWFLGRDKKTLLASRDLFILALINFILTVLPPLGTRDYKLLWEFFKDREFLAAFIAEWSPLSENLFGFITYSALFALSLAVFLFVTIKKKAYSFNLLGIPLFIMGFMGFTASRNIVLGSFALFVLIGWNLKSLLDWSSPKLKYFFWLPLTVLFVGFYGYQYVQKQKEVKSGRLYYPVQSTEFVKRYLKGRMFNDYAYGGYVLYNVYPTLNIFIDGRADVFHYYEMRDYLQLSIRKNLPDEEYRVFLNSLWDKYDINFAIVSVQKHNVMRKISRLLNTDPNWALVFWDDDSQVFVRRDGKNDWIIKELEAKYATPYLRDPYLKGRMDEALAEYERIDKIAQSAHTSNAIGFILMQKGKYDQAKERFLQAYGQDPTFESPYMNLAELAAKDGQLEEAINLYYKAQKIAPDRGLIYVRLGQLLLETGDDKKARQVWEKGVKNIVDEDARSKLKELLETLP